MKEPIASIIVMIRMLRGPAFPMTRTAVALMLTRIRNLITRALLPQLLTDAPVRLGIPNPLIRIPERRGIIPTRGSARITTAVIQMESLALGATRPIPPYVGSCVMFHFVQPRLLLQSRLLALLLRYVALWYSFVGVLF